MTQALEALEMANRVRIARARIKRMLNADEMDALEAMTLPDVQGMAVEDLLQAQKRWGQSRTARVIRAAGVRGHVRVDELTERERLNLERALLDAWATTQKNRKKTAA